MYKKVLFLAALTALFNGCSVVKQPELSSGQAALPAGVTLLESRQSKDSELAIPYQKYRFENGLILVLHEDHSDPLVHVDVTYHVGSAREEPGKSGFAHFFEHMMFQGSRNVADEQHFQIITEAGGNMNGSTNADRTNYYQTVPANQLEKVLWLEADRMGFLLDAVDQQKFEVQRETVKNERAQRVDNQPYGLRDERNSQALYPVGHPYSWSTIGYVEDLDRVSVKDLKAFFKRWYGPNNAVLTIGGDIDVKQTLEWVQKYFASIPPGPAVDDAPKTPVVLDENRYISLEDEVYLPLIQITYPTVHARHEDEAPLDVLSDILGGGKTSLFHKNLVRTGQAVQAVVSHPCQELACEFQLIALANPSVSAELADLQKTIDATLQEFEARGVNADDLNRTKASIEASTIFSLQSVAGKVSTLAMNEVFDGNPDMLQYDVERYNAVTADDVMRVYRQYIKDKARVVLSVVPVGETALAAAPANFSVPVRNIEIDTVETVPQSDTVVDNFDRSVVPSAGASPTVQVPDYWQRDMDNGITVLGHTSSEAPTVNIVLSMEGGPLLESAEQAGLAALTASLMNESTANMSSAEMANALALLGSQINFSAGGRFTQIQVSSLSKNLDQTLALLQQKLFSPAFSEDDFNNMKQRMLQSFQQRGKTPSFLAQRAVDTLLYGNDTRISLPDSGLTQTIQAISLEDVKRFYQQYYSPAHANLVVVGDLPQQQVLDKLAFLGSWTGNDYDVPEVVLGYSPAADKIYLVDNPGAAQSLVRLFRPAVPYDATGEHFRAKLMNFPFGGMFNSRINMNLREDKGYTYGASSSVAGGKSLGRFMIEADLNQQHTRAGITELVNEIHTYQQDGMTPAELSVLRNAYRQSEALRFETPYSKSTFLRQIITYGLSRDYRDQQNQIIENISTQELNSLAKQYFELDKMHMLVVGDASVIQEQLSQLGRPVEILEVAL